MGLIKDINIQKNDYISIDDGIELPNYSINNVVNDIIYIENSQRQIGFINLKTRMVNKHVTCPPAYDYIDSFKNGLARFELNGKLGIINENGIVLVKPQYTKIGEYENGIAHVERFLENSGNSLLNSNWTYSYIDLEGKLLCPEMSFEKCMTIHIFDNHDILILNLEDYNYYLINKESTKRISKRMTVIDEDHWIIYGENKICYIQNRHTGEKQEISFPYTYADGFKNGIGIVYDDKKIGLINNHGRIFLKPIYDKIKLFNDGVAPACLNDKWGIINSLGQEILKPTYDDISEFKNGIAVFEQNKKYGIINSLGQVMCEPIYNFISSFIDGYAMATVNNDDPVLINSNGAIISNYYEVISYLCQKEYASQESYRFNNLVTNKGKIGLSGALFTTLRSSRYMLKFNTPLSHGLINQEGKVIYSTVRPRNWIDYRINGKLALINNNVQKTTKIIDWMGREIIPDLKGAGKIMIVNDNYIIIHNVLINIHDIKRKYHLEIDCNGHTIDRYFDSKEERDKVVDYLEKFKNSFLLQFKSYLNSFCKDKEIKDKTKLIKLVSEEDLEIDKKRNYRKIKRLR